METFLPIATNFAVVGVVVLIVVVFVLALAALRARVRQPALSAVLDALSEFALKAVYGSIESLRASKRSKPDFETHAVIGGAGGSGLESVKGSNIKLSRDEKRYYEDLISRGLYKDWKAVEEELKYANPALRARHAGGRAA